MAPAPSTLVDILSASEAVEKDFVKAFVLQISGTLDTPAERFRLMTTKGIAAVIKGPVTDAHLNPLAQATLFQECRLPAMHMGVQWAVPSRCTAYTTNS